MEESLVLREEETDIYRELQQHLDELPIGYPPSKSGVELKILKYFFTPEEAKIAAKLKFSYETLEEIYRRAKDLEISIDELEESLDKMAKKGSIKSKKEDGKKYYGNEIFVVGMYEHKINQLTKDFLEIVNQYITEAFAIEFVGTKISQFRTVPVEKSVTPEHHMPTYEELEKIIQDLEGPISLQNCICRQAKDLLGESCKVTSVRENCMGFGDGAQLYIDNGWGRQISKEEALEVLRKNQEDGLVLQAGNAISPGFICSCCGCCCGVLENLKVLPRPVEFFSSNFFAEVDSELCVGCETCVERCQMDAIKLVKEKSKIMLKKCIGCGLCVASCPEEAITLVRKEEATVPPSSEEELYAKILDKKLEIKGKK